MITNTSPALEPIAEMKGAQKAAILLIMLGDQASAEIIKHLSEDNVQLVTREIARMKKIQPEQAEAVLEEFYTMTTARDYVVFGRHGLRQKRSDQCVWAGDGAQIVRPRGEGHGRGHGELRCRPESRSAAACEIPALGASADDRACAGAFKSLAGRCLASASCRKPNGPTWRSG